MAKRFRKLATLGDPPINYLTSSFYVAEQFALADSILPFESFEQAIAATKAGITDVALVAGAYPNIREFIMDVELQCIDAFVAKIPPLVFCSTHTEPPKLVSTLFLHPATRPIASEISAITKYGSIVETKSTSAAASQANRNSDSAAICNELAASYYNLIVHKRLRPELHMPFAIFSPYSPSENNREFSGS